MIVKCWGCRGSIPVSGQEYARHGGDTTCIEVHGSDGRRIIVDAGSGIRRLGNRILAEKCCELDLLMTHAHWDHLLGFPFFKPIYRKATDLQIYGCAFVQDSIRDLIAGTMQAPYFPVRLDDAKASISYHGCQGPFSIGSTTITPILLSHPNQGLGYRFESDGRRFVFLTDNELRYVHPGGMPYEEYVPFCQGADLLLHDAEYLESEYSYTRTWGHSVYTDALRLAMDAGVRRFGLFHHNQDRTDDALDAMVADCRSRVAQAGANLEVFAMASDMELTV